MALRSWGWRSALAIALLGPFASVALAAELAWQAPAACQRADVATAQVEKLVGRKLAAIERIGFEVEISIGEGGSHRVVLRTLAQGSAPRERTIDGASCAEVTDAVSIAIALTISEEERQQREREAAVESGLERAPSEPQPELEPDADRGELRLAVGLGLLMEAGALPELAPGLELGGALELKVLRIEAFAAVFLAQSTELPGEARGGTFDFVLAGLNVCAHPRLDALHLLACAGFELGRMGAEGRDVNNPRDGDAGWYAPRAELGVGYGFAEIARVWLRGGAAVPLARAEFVLDDTDQVHRPSSTSFRASLGLELLL